ncbi:nicotinamide-nucleotide amidohydrolase family protein [Chitinimonas arctica]|uniref:Nicotinamide-nucleotide amidohydrolase family protein n=1 Tax=Chitinimonas arctica TaxID=2594795 RepID=A0A516SJP5_9NEIS|nr:nicotinamide-nucleotide amidohydrolase family protein [Chitinimonas arctica]QDQ28353.1 nicotinamide-nucleotide amidohydrolase family protein [Chitinimonas arctica]
MNLPSLAEQLGHALLARGWRVTAAESCTGGGIASAITEVAGSSAWFDMAFVTYSNPAKQKLVGVGEATLAANGAVSEAVAGEMAAGALREAAADLAVAVSGIAGPTGGTADKPVGTVCFGWAGAAGTQTETRHFAGDRAAVRQQTVHYALAGLLARLQEKT